MMTATDASWSQEWTGHLGVGGIVKTVKQKRAHLVPETTMNDPRRRHRIQCIHERVQCPQNTLTIVQQKFLAFCVFILQLFVYLFFFFWPLYCRPFLDLRLLVVFQNVLATALNEHQFSQRNIFRRCKVTLNDHVWHFVSGKASVHRPIQCPTFYLINLLFVNLFLL